MVKNPPTSAADATDLGSIPGLGRSPEKEMSTHSIFAWRIPWTVEPSGPTVHEIQKESDRTEHLSAECISMLNNIPIIYVTIESFHDKKRKSPYKD